MVEGVAAVDAGFRARVGEDAATDDLAQRAGHVAVGHPQDRREQRIVGSPACGGSGPEDLLGDVGQCPDAGEKHVTELRWQLAVDVATTGLGRGLDELLGEERIPVGP